MKVCDYRILPNLFLVMSAVVRLFLTANTDMCSQDLKLDND